MCAQLYIYNKNSKHSSGYLFWAVATVFMGSYVSGGVFLKRSN